MQSGQFIFKLADADWDGNFPFNGTPFSTNVTSDGTYTTVTINYFWVPPTTKGVTFSGRSYVDKVVEIIQWGNIPISSTSGQFKNLANGSNATLISATDTPYQLPV